ncbi:NucA/NucB deoxyribonuclease domain-containing protein [Streptomyces goshikiensis]|uniref:NucA/NucB deoxyribonuclease domain-containing protein n=1 Tax=Streptomyces goshikiensis TaxID=1942 RepID=UPI0036AD3429
MQSTRASSPSARCRPGALPGLAPVRRTRRSDQHLKDPAVDQSARHILDAQQLPERTFPSWAGKTVPGATEPLHRLIDKDKQKKNREKAIATCNDAWGNYMGTTLQCDEYPFASTKEGAAAPGNRFSARLIDGTDNETGGRKLNEMFTLNRILDGDAFYVKITP